jgi:hypothetical protein
MNVSHLFHNCLRPKIKAQVILEKVVMRAKVALFHDKLYHCIARIKQMARTWGKHDAERRQLKEHQAREDLVLAQKALQEDPQNVWLQEAVKQCCATMDQINQEQAEWISSITEQNWLIKGDRGFKIFLEKHKFRAKSKDTQISGLLIETGVMVNDWDGIAELGVEYYSKLFASKVKLKEEQLKEIFAMWKVRLTEEEQAAMDVPMTLGNLETVGNKMETKQAPVPDCDRPGNFSVLLSD